MDYWNTNDGDDGDSSAVSSDDDMEKFGRKLPRHRYKTHDEDDTDGAEDDGNSQHHRRHASRSRRQEEALYGVFAEDVDDSDSDNDSSRRSRKRPRSHRSSSSSTAVTGANRNVVPKAPIFVKGRTIDKPKPSPPSATAAASNLPSTETNMEKDTPTAATTTTVDTAAAAATQTSSSVPPSPPRIGKDAQAALDAEAARDAELRRETDAANAQFAALLQQGRSRHRTLVAAASRGPPLPRAATDVPPAMTTAPPCPAAPGLGMPTHTPFGLGSSSQRPPQSIPHSTTTTTIKRKIDPTLGAWEKHTKGIGAKLLAKMGYSGSGGLGGKRRRRPAVGGTDPQQPSQPHPPFESSSNEARGIAKPVQVKVRPANLGLGYGNFKEATRLKDNRQIEAQVRGLPDPDDQDPKAPSATKTSNHRGGDGGPSVTDLLQTQSWKRGRAKRTFVSQPSIPIGVGATATTPVTILDMRGPSDPTRDTHSSHDALDSGLAQELLHNVTVLCRTHETQRQTAVQWADTHQRHVASEQRQLEALREEQRAVGRRREQLQTVVHRVDEIRAAVEGLQQQQQKEGEKYDSVSSLASTWETVWNLLEQLGSTFTEKERRQLKFAEVLVPSLMGGVIAKALNAWEPFQDDKLAASKPLLRLILCAEKSDIGPSTTIDRAIVCRVILKEYVLPRIKRALIRWDPTLDTEEAVLVLYEQLVETLRESNESFLSMAKGNAAQTNEAGKGDNEDSTFVLLSEDEPPKNDYIELARREVADSAVFEKISRAVQDYKPRLSKSDGSLTGRVDAWVLPWLPHFGQAMIPSLVADCKRKVKSTLICLEKMKDDEQFLSASLRSLRPWRGIFKKETLVGLVSDFITPRLARTLAHVPNRMIMSKDRTNSSDWATLDITFQFHAFGLMSNMEFLSVIEGELLLQWVYTIHTQLASKQSAFMDTVCGLYVEWKDRLFGLSTKWHKNAALKQSYDVLQNDPSICCCFYAVLLLIQAVSENLNASSSTNTFSRLRPAAGNYRIVYARRKAEARLQAADDLLRAEESATATTHDTVEARVRLNHDNHGRIPSFREVVQEFASERDVLFQPRMGINSTKDGKQVFLFGSVPMYLDSNVAYVWNKSGDWEPMSLDAIAERNENTT